jgi:hypothetical protein
VAVGEGITTGEGVAIGGGVIVARPGNKEKPLFKTMLRAISKEPTVPSTKRVAGGRGFLTNSSSVFPPLIGSIGRMPNKKRMRPHKNRMTSKGKLWMIFSTSCIVASLCG